MGFVIGQFAPLQKGNPFCNPEQIDLEGLKGSKNEVSQKIGLARVSTIDQNLGMQINALKQAGCRKVFREKVSGVSEIRPGLDSALAALEPGDTLVVWRLDRLGRSLTHLIEIVMQLRDAEINFQSLMEHLDTNSASGRLFFHIAGAFAEFEFSINSERTKEAMHEARERGQHLGRPPLLTPQQIFEARDCLGTKAMTFKQAADHFGVHPNTIRNALKQLRSPADGKEN